jgi:hypothetical protein
MRLAPAVVVPARHVLPVRGQAEVTMAIKLVTCPETAHLEAIGCLEARDGELLLVTSCSRFQPTHDVRCDALCAKLLNLRRVMANAVPNDASTT